MDAFVDDDAKHVLPLLLQRPGDTFFSHSPQKQPPVQHLLSKGEEKKKSCSRGKEGVLVYVLCGGVRAAGLRVGQAVREEVTYLTIQWLSSSLGEHTRRVSVKGTGK